MNLLHVSTVSSSIAVCFKPVVTALTCVKVRDCQNTERTGSRGFQGPGGIQGQHPIWEIGRQSPQPTDELIKPIFSDCGISLH